MKDDLPPQTRRDGGASQRQRGWNDRPMLPATRHTIDPNVPGPSWWVSTPPDAFTEQARIKAKKG